MFARSTIRQLEQVAGFLGPDKVAFHSQDDNANVPIGLTAENKQTPLVMHVEYKLKFLDHDFAVAKQYKMVPSVIGDMHVKAKTCSLDAVKYSGPTYIGFRTAKTHGSSAYNHLIDMKRIRELPEFERNFREEKSKNEENWLKTISYAVVYFNTYDLDGFFLVTNAPGRSACNRVERRMTLPSKESGDVLLEHEQFGAHLDDKGNTTDFQLELKKFGHTGSILGERWNGMVIDGYPVLAEYVGDKTSEIFKDVSEKWRSSHVRSSQYLLQIVRCNNITCCTLFRSSYKNVVNVRFLPPPFAMSQSLGDGFT